MTDLAVYITKVGSRAVHKAQKKNTQKGIPNVYSMNGKIFYQLPNGEITEKSPFKWFLKSFNIYNFEPYQFDKVFLFLYCYSILKMD